MVYSLNVEYIKTTVPDGEMKDKFGEEKFCISNVA